MRRDLTATLDWSLARLTRLTELTLHGTEAIDVMLKLLRSPATPALPASLVTLRQDNREGIHFSRSPGEQAVCPSRRCEGCLLHIRHHENLR